ncbi:hypothetical protein CROQUDRAFT_10387, partial [Cronartium quercuum f. sp. fusiforme G11]
SNPIDPITSSVSTIESSLVFGMPVQQYAQKFLNVLHKFQLTTKLTDKNYYAWHQPILELFMTIEYHQYLLKSEFKAPSINDEQHNKAKFIITT